MTSPLHQVDAAAKRYMAEHPGAQYGEALQIVRFSGPGGYSHGWVRDDEANEIYPGDKVKMPDGSTYTVVEGDTLGAIATKAGASVDDLKKLNPELTGKDAAPDAGKDSGKDSKGGGKGESKGKGEAKKPSKKDQKEIDELDTRMGLLDPGSGLYQDLAKRKADLKAGKGGDTKKHSEVAGLHEDAMALMAECPGITYAEALQVAKDLPTGAEAMEFADTSPGTSSSARRLQRYWQDVPTYKGKMAGIAWDVGSHKTSPFYRCTARVSKFMTPDQAKGY